MKFTNNFLLVRALTFLWGFTVIYYFTGKLDFTSKVFLIQALGNTLIMWSLIKERK